MSTTSAPASWRPRGDVQPKVVQHPIPVRHQPDPRSHAAAIRASVAAARESALTGRRPVAVACRRTDPFGEPDDTCLVLRRRIEPFEVSAGFASHLFCFRRIGQNRRQCSGKSGDVTGRNQPTGAPIVDELGNAPTPSFRPRDAPEPCASRTTRPRPSDQRGEHQAGGLIDERTQLVLRDRIKETDGVRKAAAGYRSHQFPGKGPAPDYRQKGVGNRVQDCWPRPEEHVDALVPLEHPDEEHPGPLRW